MKNFKLRHVLLLCITVIALSCSKDGATGPAGPAGADGIDGTNGTNGTDGVDGADGISCWDLNANGIGDVEEDLNNDGNFDANDCQGVTVDPLVLDFDVSTFTGSILNQPTEIPVADFENYAFFVYFESTSTSLWYSIPGPMPGNNYYSRLYYNLDDLNNVGNLTISIWFYLTDDNSNYVVSSGSYDRLRLVGIDLGLGGKGTQEDVMAQLKAAGVDTTDYNAMAAYFGLE